MWADLRCCCAIFAFLSTSRQNSGERLIRRTHIASSESLLLTSGGIVIAVENTGTGGCGLKTKRIGGSFVDHCTWSLYDYDSDVIFLSKSCCYLDIQ